MTAYFYVAITPRYRDHDRLTMPGGLPVTYIKIGDTKDPDARAKEYESYNPDVALFPITLDSWDTDELLADEKVKDELIARVGSYGEFMKLFEKGAGKFVDRCVFGENYSKAATGLEWFKAANCEAKIQAFFQPQAAVGGGGDWKHYKSPLEFILALREVIDGHSL